MELLMMGCSALRRSDAETLRAADAIAAAVAGVPIIVVVR